MNLKSSFLYASKILNPPLGKKSTGRKSLIGAVFCIALSLVPLVLVLTVSDGMIEGITARMVGLSSYHAVAYYPYGISQDNLEFQKKKLEDTCSYLQGVDGVTGAFIEASGTSLAAGKNGRSGAQIRAVNSRIFFENTSFKKYIKVEEGQANFPTQQSAVIGKKIASDLGVHVGDSIRLIGAKTLDSGTVLPRVKIFKVSGIVSSGYEELDALWVFVPLEQGMGFLAGTDARLKIGLEVKDAFNNNFSHEISKITSVLPNNWNLYTWNELNTSQYENFSSTRILLLLIMFLILLVASVNISAAIVMIVMERRSEIAILKSMGASPAGIATSFIICGTCCGIGGVIVGVPLGLLCSVKVNEILDFTEILVNDFTKFVYIILGKTNYTSVDLLNPAYYLDSIPIQIPFTELFGIAFGTIFLSIMVSLLPSMRAGQEKSLSIFRKL